MSQTTDLIDLIAVLAEWPKRPVPEGQIACGCHERLRLALRQMQLSPEAVGAGDLAGLVGHVLSYQSLANAATRELPVPARPGWPTRQDWERSGCRIVLDQGDHLILAASAPWWPAWLDRPADASTSPVGGPFVAAILEEVRRLDRPENEISLAADPCIPLELGARFWRYQSQGQQQAIRAAFLCKPGSTVLITLPTGAGKSLATWAPALVGASGMTLVVVPTVALSIDQEGQVRKITGVSQPLAYHSGLPDADRELMRTRIRTGNQRLVFASPESIVGGLSPALHAAAKVGFLRYFIVDEAHLVAQWGNDFRPEFQSLAGLRSDLLARCPAHGRFRTLLMTATLTAEAYKTIGTLFGPPLGMEVVSSIHLRPEPSYWVSRADDADVMRERLLNVVRHAPRPFIFYVTKPDEARYWHGELGAMGLRRIRCVHGQTPNDQRAGIIDAWRDNEIDVVVGNAAFGVGMDKADVRAIIHACVPETVDRFYQEVGRGGRDGRACTSILVYTDEDLKMGRSLNEKRIVGVAKGLERWKAMLAHSQWTGGGSAVGADGIIRVNLRAKRPGVDRDSDANEAWNVRTLSLMARAGLIELAAHPPPALTRADGEDEGVFAARCDDAMDQYFNSSFVCILDPRHEDINRWKECIEPFRGASQSSDEMSLRLMEEVLLGTREMSEILFDAYQVDVERRAIEVERACGGCWRCRADGINRSHYHPPRADPIRNTDYVLSDHLLRALRLLDPRGDFRVVVYSRPGSKREESKWRQTLLQQFLPMVVRHGIIEIATGPAWVQEKRYQQLHQQADGRFLVHRSIDETPPLGGELQLPRVSLVDATGPSTTFPRHLMLLARPLHVVLVPDNTVDLDRPDRMYADVAACIRFEDVLVRLNE